MQTQQEQFFMCADLLLVCVLGWKYSISFMSQDLCLSNVAYDILVHRILSHMCRGYLEASDLFTIRSALRIKLKNYLWGHGVIYIGVIEMCIRMFMLSMKQSTFVYMSVANIDNV